MIVIVLCVLIVGQAVLAWSATGRHWFTRYRSSEIATVDKAHDAASALFDTQDEAAARPDANAENDFAFGWLPSGMGREAFSVLTVGGPALLAAVIVVLCGGRKR